uniref:Uncharacterized protein n=1 Tax=Lactuca sativa TaxID=4236 RepID=A0A9R1VE01_LACSA|nr:hypothetical protein LSAT_V11C500259150 [Lactuca sativa]
MVCEEKHSETLCLVSYLTSLSYKGTDAVISPDGIKWLYLKVGDTKMVYGPEEFCLITGFSFLAATGDDAIRACLIYVLCEGFLGKEANDRNFDGWNIFAWGSYLWEFTYDNREDMWNKINKYLSLPEPCQSFKYSVSGFTAPFRIWIYKMLPFVRSGYVLCRNKDTPWMKRWSATKKLKWVDVNKIFDMTKEGRRPRHSMTSSDEERRSSYYMSC